MTNKTTLYIIEGSDASGKTSLVNQLAEKTGFTVVKGSNFEQAKCTNEELYQKFLELAKLENVVLDRFTYSNFVYASLYDDYSILTKEQLRHIESLIKHKAELVFLHAPLEVLESRLSVRGDDYVKVEELKAISESYHEAIDEVGALLTWEFDTSTISTEGIVDLLLS